MQTGSDASGNILHWILGISGVIILLAMIAGLLFLYFTPARIAFKNDHDYKGVILALCLPLPIFFPIGWAIAWALVYWKKDKPIWEILNPGGGDLAKTTGNSFARLKNTGNYTGEISKINELKQSGAISNEHFTVIRDNLVENAQIQSHIEQGTKKMHCTKCGAKMEIPITAQEIQARCQGCNTVFRLKYGKIIM